MTNFNNAAMIQLAKWSNATTHHQTMRYARRSFRMAMMQMERSGMRAQFKEAEALAHMLTMSAD